MDRLKAFNSKSVTHIYIGYSEQNHRKNTIVCHGVLEIKAFGLVLQLKIYFQAATKHCIYAAIQ
jgi:hypothetical protein